MFNMLNNTLMFFEGENTNKSTIPQWLIYVILGALVVFMIVTSLLQRRKQKKQAEQMTNNLKIGATITTIGGIVGTLIRMDEEQGCYSIETGIDDNKHVLKIVKNAIYSVHSQTPSEEVEEVTNEIK